MYDCGYCKGISKGGQYDSVFLAPIYIIVNIYIFMRITGWLKTGFPVLGTRRGIVLSAAVYSFFAVFCAGYDRQKYLFTNCVKMRIFR